MKFAHIRPPKVNGVTPSKGGITIAFNYEGNSCYSYACAYCHPNDNYNKRLGRAKAGGRLNSQKHVKYLDNIDSPKELIDILVQDLI